MGAVSEAESDVRPPPRMGGADHLLSIITGGLGVFTGMREFACRISCDEDGPSPRIRDGAATTGGVPDADQAWVARRSTRAAL